MTSPGSPASPTPSGPPTPADPPPPIDPARLHVTFPDGVLSYECRGCGACCKGLGIGVDARGELDALLAVEPSLAPFARLRAETWTFFNPRGRCWFLDDEGWCRVERDHGRDLKPASCRLFPFNRVFRLDGWTIIDFNSVICPLRALPPDAPDDALGLSGRVRHAALLDELGAVGDPALTTTPLRLDGLDASTLLTAEVAFARACFALAPAASASAGDLEALAGLASGAAAEAARRLASVLDAPALPGALTLQRALWLTPSLRFNALFSPQRLLPQPALLDALSMTWLVWLHSLRHGELLARRALTLQEITATWSELLPLASTLALWDAPLHLPPGPVAIDDGPLRPSVLAVGNALAGNHRAAPAARRSLEALAAPHLRALKPHARAALLRQLAPLLARALDAPPLAASPAAAPPASAPRGLGRRKGKNKRRR